MSATYSWEVIRKLVVERASAQCEYCLTQILLSGQAMQIDHIMPKSRQGSSDLSNLCLACTFCNLHKSSRIESIDSVTKSMTLLFNPRQQQWADHFRWVDNVFIEGFTPVGRVTVDLLNMNNSIVVNSRRIWAEFGLHPPN